MAPACAGESPAAVGDPAPAARAGQYPFTDHAMVAGQRAVAVLIPLHPLRDWRWPGKRTSPSLPLSTPGTGEFWPGKLVAFVVVMLAAGLPGWAVLARSLAASCPAWSFVVVLLATALPVT
jgi:hypothetical protein